MTFAPVDLPEAFPCTGGGLYVQRDRPISFLHLHDCIELGYCHDGAGIFMVGRKVLPFRAGDVSVITEHEVHLARSVEGTVSRWTWVYFDPVRLIGPAGDPKELDLAGLCGERFNNIVSPGQDRELGPLLRALITELDGRGMGWQSAVRGLVWTIACRLRRLPGGQRPGAPANKRETTAIERLAPALQVMLNRYHQPISMDDLAHACAMSPATFRRCFHHATGSSPLDYLTRVRMQMATSLLADMATPISDVAFRVGYGTLSSFNRHFRRTMRMSPRQWRRSMGS